MSDAFNWRSPTQVALASALWVVSSGPHLTVDLKGMTMNKNYRTLAALSVLALSSWAAQAQSVGAFGEGSNYPAAASTQTTLTRAAVAADLAAARANGTMPHDAEGSDVAYSDVSAHGSRSRAEVRAEAIAAARAHKTDRGEF